MAEEYDVIETIDSEGQMTVYDTATGEVILGGCCPIGPLGLHTYNYERTQCLWCGPDRLGCKPGKWVDIGGGKSAWSANPAKAKHPATEEVSSHPSDRSPR